MDGVMHTSLFLGAVFTRWPPPSTTITTTATIKPLASPLLSPTWSPSPLWSEHACFPWPLMMLSTPKHPCKIPWPWTRHNNPHPSTTWALPPISCCVAQVAFVPFTCQLVSSPCSGIHHLAIQFTVINGKRPSPGELAVSNCAVHQRQINRNLKITSLLTHQLWKRSLLTGVGYWLMSSCSMPVWSGSWLLLINWPSWLKRKKNTGISPPQSLAIHWGMCYDVLYCITQCQDSVYFKGSLKN